MAGRRSIRLPRRNAQHAHRPKDGPACQDGWRSLLRWRKPELKAAGVELTDARTTGVVDGKPVLADGRVLDVANVVWCTGFAADYEWIRPPIDVDEHGWPIQHRGVTSVPGLYFMGILFQYSFASMNVYGVSRDAAYVVDRAAERLAAGARVAGAVAATALGSRSARCEMLPPAERSTGHATCSVITGARGEMPPRIPGDHPAREVARCSASMHPRGGKRCQSAGAATS